MKKQLISMLPSVAAGLTLGIIYPPANPLFGVTLAFGGFFSAISNGVKMCENLDKKSKIKYNKLMCESIIPFTLIVVNVMIYYVFLLIGDLLRGGMQII